MLLASEPSLQPLRWMFLRHGEDAEDNSLQSLSGISLTHMLSQGCAAILQRASAVYPLPVTLDRTPGRPETLDADRHEEGRKAMKRSPG